jgi:hypothetical protein
MPGFIKSANQRVRRTLFLENKVKLLNNLAINQVQEKQIFFFLRLQSSISKKASRDASKRSNNANPKIIDLTLEKVELKTAENAWKPTNRKEATNGDISMVRS